MEARITSSGKLVIKAESELEAYALRRRAEENMEMKAEEPIFKRVVVDVSFPVKLPTDK
jgi:hypothetical protein